MASLFQEFSMTFDRFQNELPKHPLAEELRTSIVRGRFPNEQWLKSRIKKMNDLLEPPWLRDDHHQLDKKCA